MKRALLHRAAIALGLTFATPVVAADTAGDARKSAEAERQDVARAIDDKAAEQAAVAERAAALKAEVGRLRQALRTAAANAQAQADALAAARAAEADAAAAADFAADAIEAKQRELAGLLGAMARLSRRPPEALAALKDGPAEAARASLAFQALLPEVERRIAAARQSLAEAAGLQKEHVDRRQALAAAVDAHERERQALALAVEEKRQLFRAANAEGAALGAERARLAKEAESLDGFIAELTVREAARAREEARAAAKAEAQAREQARLAAEAKAAKAVAEKAKADADAAKATQAKRPPSPQPPARQGKPIELAGLEKARGDAVSPVAGRLAARFGEGKGSLSQGWVYDARPTAVVFAPFDGRVAYAGPFRGYGKVALIDHGQGYHTLLTGLGRIDVAVGDWVLQGEPLGLMPPADTKEKVAAGRKSDAGTSEPQGPKLYVELRRNGDPVDPAPWFARPT